jgi:biotin-[acetyl-CoA-carboxylase] ligase BirA-like protein
VITCDKQTAGIGRQGKPWKSAKLHLAMQLCFELPSLVPASLSLCIANALAHYLQAKGVPAKVKWPNDIWTARGKIAGLILETVTYESKIFCLVGLGLNISNPIHQETQEQEPLVIDQPVDYALRYLVDTPQIEFLALEIAHDLRKAMEDQEVAPLDVAFFMRDSWTCPGALIEASLEEGRIEGTIIGFDATGDIILKTAPGEERRLRSGACKKVRVIQHPQMRLQPITHPTASSMATQTTTRETSFIREK